MIFFRTKEQIKKAIEEDNKYFDPIIKGLEEERLKRERMIRNGVDTEKIAELLKSNRRCLQ